MFLYTKKDCFAVGGGEFAIRVGEDFLKGECGISNTFDNDMLSDKNFSIRKFEVWGINY